MSRSQRTEEQTDRLFRGTVGRSAVLVAALVALQSTAFCQGDEKPRIAFADQETCGDPRLESQLWRSVTGVVKEVASPTTIRILVSEPSPHVLTVKLLGVRSPAGRKSARDAISFLRRTAEGHSVTISLGLSDKYSERPKAQRVEGWLGSVAMAMVESGVAAYERPKPYRVPHYDMCRLKLAGDKARMARAGMWQGSVSER